MPSKNDTVLPDVSSKAKKRKEPPQSSSKSEQNLGRGRVKRVKIHTARTISTQNADAALKNGELDLQSFLKSREFEIKALENGMRSSKTLLNLRAFQQVPRDLRRRTASHNVKRVPKRMQNRARREMREDNTPTVMANKRKPGSSRGRIRAETAKRLGILAEKKKASKANSGDSVGIATRAPRPKIRTGRLNDPPNPKAKFRKRQIHKTWLPTHLWHAKRATMTEPKNPLWRFSLPLTCTEKSYRPTHRAGGARGAVAWDMSYMSTISLEGPVESLEKVLRKLNIIGQESWGGKGHKWRSGKRSWSGWLSREEQGQRLQIGPSTIIWCPEGQDSPNAATVPTKKSRRQLFIRVHPSAFLETWTEVLRLSKLQRPAVQAVDLRFEIGSIEIAGPGSTEALLGILHPYPESEERGNGHSQTFTSLAGVTNPGSLPSNVILSLSIIDPRLRYPPQPVQLPKATDEDANFALLQMLSTWPADESLGSSALFDRDSRFKATHLPSQKSINRRKGLAPPGAYPPIVPTDPRIPIMLVACRSNSANSVQGTWTLLAPWKCILPIWYGLVHYPLSSGGNMRFGGLQEQRQIYFEQKIPWFPADYPGTRSGFAWETDQRQKREAEWEKRPKGKRIEWHSLDLGVKGKGEIGKGWACDFESIVGPVPVLDGDSSAATTQESQKTQAVTDSQLEIPIMQIDTKDFSSLLSSADAVSPSRSAVATIRITLVSRGIASPCARIYRLPEAPASQESNSSSLPATSREQWLSLLPAASGNSKPPPNPKSKTAKDLTRIPLNTPLPQRVRLLAQSLLQDPPLPYPVNKTNEDDYPVVPGEEDLVGFVTTGEFNLAEGKGVAVGSVVVTKVLESLRRDKQAGCKEGRLCIVRNAGEKMGRLARWEPV